jgi:hypothetical protein
VLIRDGQEKGIGVGFPFCYMHSLNYETSPPHHDPHTFSFRRYGRISRESSAIEDIGGLEEKGKVVSYSD